MEKLTERSHSQGMKASLIISLHVIWSIENRKWRLNNIAYLTEARSLISLRALPLSFSLRLPIWTCAKKKHYVNLKTGEISTCCHLSERSDENFQNREEELINPSDLSFTGLETNDDTYLLESIELAVRDTSDQINTTEGSLAYS